jgi:hypothetical protein
MLYVGLVIVLSLGLEAKLGLGLGLGTSLGRGASQIIAINQNIGIRMYDPQNIC